MNAVKKIIPGQTQPLHATELKLCPAINLCALLVLLHSPLGTLLGWQDPVVMWVQLSDYSDLANSVSLCSFNMRGSLMIYLQ